MSILIDEADIEADVTTQCVVVGAGACGLVAALALADANVEALVLERDAQATGSTSLSSGFIPAVGTKAQRKSGIQDDAALFAADIQRKAGNEADQRIVDAVVNKSGPVLDWLQAEHGIDWVLLDDFLYPGHSAHRMHAVPEKTGAALQTRLANAVSQQGVDIISRARVDALIVRRNHNAAGVDVCGVRITRPDGSFEMVKAQFVILACNGYGGNIELMQRFIPEMARADYFGHSGNTGDAVIWGELLGASLKHMGAYQGHGSVASGHNILITWALMMEGGVQINLDGVRFSNEHAGYSEQAVNVIQQPEQCVWNIYDHRLHQMGLNFPDYKQAFETGAMIVADDVQRLSHATQLPLMSLRDTLQQIDKLAKHNEVDTFGRQFNLETQLKPPYYAVKVRPAVFHTQGGLAINESAQVVDNGEKPITGLLAAGGAACGVSGSSVSGYLSGNGLLTAVTLGLIAAETVIELQRKTPI